ncbi:serine hydrolase [Streptomyces sp. BBFR2]|uniref:serine hydrolase n=1 Tax=Streptomyces sp. BBFR2 TaxID=3372854 RepID=UPI0037DA69A3
MTKEKKAEAEAGGKGWVTARKWAAGLIALTASAAAVAPAHAATLPVGTAARSAVAGTAVSCVSVKPGLAKRLADDMAARLKTRRSMASLALYDRTTRTTCTYGAHKRYDSASTVKPIVLGALLMDRKGRLTAREAELAEKMIEHSDNASTTALWRQLSDLRNPKRPDPVKIQRFLNAAGMTDTVLDRTGNWGLTQITAADQITLLKLFTGRSNTVLSAASRAYALRLMHAVEKAQRWGTPAGAPAGATVHVKNGWLQRSQTGPKDPFDRGDWKVNSLGAFTGAGYDYGLVVLTENNRVPKGRPATDGWVYGINTIEQVSRAAHHALYPTGSAPRRYAPPRPGTATLKQLVTLG